MVDSNSSYDILVCNIELNYIHFFIELNLS